jgi:hypothetical protein
MNTSTALPPRRMAGGGSDPGRCGKSSELIVIVI